MTFDEWYDYKRMMHLFRPEDIARAAYEAGARSRDEEVRTLVEAGDKLAAEIESTTESPLALEFLADWRAAIKGAP
jgi:hypothetical protein